MRKFVSEWERVFLLYLHKNTDTDENSYYDLDKNKGPRKRNHFHTNSILTMLICTISINIIHTNAVDFYRWLCSCNLSSLGQWMERFVSTSHMYLQDTKWYQVAVDECGIHIWAQCFYRGLRLSLLILNKRELNRTVGLSRIEKHFFWYIFTKLSVIFHTIISWWSTAKLYAIQKKSYQHFLIALNFILDFICIST